MLRIALLWAITQREVVICYRHSGTTYCSGPERLWGISTTPCVIALKRAVNVCFQAEPWNHAFIMLCIASIPSVQCCVCVQQ